MTVAVYTCTLNEAKHVERWYESAKDADCLLMLDTGSSDYTVEVARDLGILVHEAVISPFRFDDARNVALALIPRTIDVVIQLDADEVFQPGWRQVLDQVPANENRWSYWLEPEAGHAWTRSLRSNAHRRHGFRWVHPVHEVITGPDADSHIDITIIHKPDLTKDRSYLLDMLATAVREAPHDHRVRFYYGRELHWRGMWGQARTHLNHFLGMRTATWGAERSEALMMIAAMDYNPIRWYWKAVAECPERREPYVALARFLADHGEPDAARGLLNIAATKVDQSLYIAHTDCWGQPFDALVARVDAMMTP
jgi:glycosyltransferase involved in cell wall biosynthesis